MMAPHYERARMLAVAIDRATAELGEPIDRIEVTARKVLVWAGRRYLSMTYGYANSYGPGGTAIPGGGTWVVEPDGPLRQDSSVPIGGLFSALRRLLAR